MIKPVWILWAKWEESSWATIRLQGRTRPCHTTSLVWVLLSQQQQRRFFFGAGDDDEEEAGWTIRTGFSSSSLCAWFAYHIIPTLSNYNNEFRQERKGESLMKRPRGTSSSQNLTWNQGQSWICCCIFFFSYDLSLICKKKNMCVCDSPKKRISLPIFCNVLVGSAWASWFKLTYFVTCQSTLGKTWSKAAKKKLALL